MSQEEVPEALKNDNQCCETLKRIADHLIICSSEAPSEENSVVEMEAVVSTDKFSRDILSEAERILALPQRQLPLFACIVGHLKEGNDEPPDEDIMDSSSWLTKKNRKEKSKNSTPYIFYWDSKNYEQPIPLFPLTKIDEGPTEAVGYTTVCIGALSQITDL